MKINVGDYVRDKNGRVGKVFDITNEPSVDVGIGIIPEVNAVWIDKDKINYLYQEEITKHSKDIIDLIEVGDYVNGYLIDYINLECETPFLRSNRPYRADNSLYSTLSKKGKDYNQPLHFYNEDIKSIVTKEQFEANAYTIEKER